MPDTTPEREPSSSAPFTPKSADELEDTAKADGLGLDPKLIVVLKEHYGPIIGLRMEGNAGGVLVFRKPPRNVYFKFINKLQDKDPRKQTGSAEALEELACSCLVYPVDGNNSPDYTKARSYFAEYPGAAFSVAGDLSEMAGASDSNEAKKL